MRRPGFLSLFIGFAVTIGCFISYDQTPVQADGEVNRVFLPLLTNGGSASSQPEATTEFPTLTQFVEEVRSGEDRISGVYVADILANPIIQQSNGDFSYISNEEEIITQFMLTTPDVVGLLAHNHLAGKKFFEIKDGDWIYLINGKGEYKRYQVNEIRSYQVISLPDSAIAYQDLQTGEILDTAGLFQRFYMGAPHLTLQTCINRDGNPSWGRLFITAQPVD